MSSLAMGTAPALAAQCSAVVPSTSVAFTSERSESSVRTAAASSRLTASSRFIAASARSRANTSAPSAEEHVSTDTDHLMRRPPRPSCPRTPRASKPDLLLPPLSPMNRPRSDAGQRLQFQVSAAVPIVLEADAHPIHHGEQEIHHRRALGVLQMTAALEPSRSTHEQQRQICVRVL